MAKLKESGPSAHLTSDLVIAECLAAALEEANTDVFLAAIGNVSAARRLCAAADRER